MRQVHTIGLDIAKEVFQVHGVGQSRSKVLRRKLKREDVEQFFSEIPRSLVGIEACSTSHHWARTIARLGHSVKLMPAQYVKAYVKVQKTDANDAEAICEAVGRPTMRFVPIKSKKQQAILLLHTAREFFARRRVASINALRGCLAEFGVVEPAGRAGLGDIVAFARALTPRHLPKNALTVIRLLADELTVLTKRISECGKAIEEAHERDTKSKRLAEIPGVGALTASALVASIGDPRRFKSGRQFSAWLGLVPKQSSSGGIRKKGGITRAGNRYLRKLLYMGASAALRNAKSSKAAAAFQEWGERLRKRRPYRVTVIAMASKIARICWAMLSKGEDFRLQSAT